MNIFFLSEKRDKNVLVTEKAVRNARSLGGEVWRGFDIQPDEAPQIRIRGATAFYPFRLRPQTVGWSLTATGRRARARLAFASPDSEEPAWPAAEVELEPGEVVPAVLPWRLDRPTSPDAPLDLLIHVPPKSGGPVFLGVHRTLDRSQAIKLCTGRGVEIGPGPHPQILPRAGIDVSYVEQMPPAEWRRLYDPTERIKVDESLWDRYRVGDAHDLPVEDGSLDFIFTSHVFEHLANPIKHLEIWGAKLRKGGRIVAVVPDLAGAKDYAADLSDVRDLVNEYDVGEMAPNAAHYARYAALRGAKDGGKDMFENRRSIHVHFYTHSNMAQLLTEASRRFGFEGFSIVHTNNHKDFYFVVVK